MPDWMLDPFEPFDADPLPDDWATFNPWNRWNRWNTEEMTTWNA